MYWLLGLLVLETIGEGLLCNGLVRSFSLNRLACIAAGSVLALLTLALSVSRWQVWLWTAPLAAYRLINLARMSVRRLPLPHLNSVSLRAFKWLVLAQSVTAIGAALIERYSLGLFVFNGIVAGQLLCAIVLLRASTHTWQHAYASNAVPNLTDKQLPSLSILIPARNETDDLERCLTNMIASDYPKLEIVVLDDCSNGRRTPEIIRSFAQHGVRFIQGTAPDETHWLAKNHAYAQLAEAASGDVLLFCGVDAIFGPHTVRRLVEQLYGRNKAMLSVMPLRAREARHNHALLQATRYYWEMCLPRRFFKRPPVLSTCWLIQAGTLRRMGGFESVSRSVNPEAPLARQAVATDSYAFIRSDDSLEFYSSKPLAEQYNTSIRVRYPQLHRRLELIALVAIFEAVFLLGPLIGLLCCWLLPHAMAYAAMWSVALACLYTTYALVAVGARLTNGFTGWMLMPIAFIADLAVLHISLFRYEFSTVEWKGRNICIPVMRTAGTDRSTAFAADSE